LGFRVTLDGRTKAERSFYERLIVFEEDFRHADYFASFLLKKGWHFDPWEKKIRWSTYMQQAAFTSALVTAYCRPFAQSRGKPALSVKMARYNTQQKALHEKLCTLRDQVYAHSEVSIHNVRPCIIGGVPSAIVTLPILKLAREEVEDARGMIHRMLAAIRRRLQDLAPRMAAEA
jgi:hypothetical protein